MGEVLLDEEAEGHRGLAGAWGADEEEIVLCLKGFQEDVIVVGVIGLGERQAGVGLWRPLPQEQGTTGGQGRDELIEAAHPTAGRAVGRAVFDGIATTRLRREDIRILLAVVEPHHQLMGVYLLQRTFI